MTALTDLNEEIKRCQDCDLAKNRTKVVPGEGPDNAALLFIGEAPGWHEDQQGRPFVGPAGQFLEELLSTIGLRRDQVFIANVIKCRPSANRDPLPGEIQACKKWLDRQIELIQPKVVVTLGRYSMARYFPNQSISKIHGKSKKEGEITYYAMYHPAAALHQGSLRKIIEADMLKIPQLLAQTDKLTEAETEPQQLSMF
ncbi:MAG: uracil-DNA glycosylase [Chloroflexi bacterium]|nr:uracil-DNA glycosylase [Chloroflexota bacterium]MBM3154574.1 uracil-DNA glycosylase [Chloroflexota bacterium]MBM3173275.1 uracil-DNA glycosylase [Chloroflexota bacterium]MBM3175127.1 uracil-DNA glycosylase [Chloroflexota bacterium]MBM4449782.1 uracil-DNA glycosylase [Chloroflexota bacterium]